MRLIREILLTEYIGAIVVGVLIADALSTLVSTLVELLAIHFSQFHAHGVSAAYSFLSGATRIAMLLLSAYLLAVWLYGTKVPAGGSHVKRPQENESA